MITFFGNTRQGGHIAPLITLLESLRKRHIRFCFNSEFAHFLACHGFTPKNDEITNSIPSDSTTLVSVGGDGTFLRAAAWAAGREIPVMGINTGHLGYLAGFSLENPSQIIGAIQGCVDISPRITLQATSSALPADFYPYALNEISISKGDTTSMVTIKAWIDNKFLANYLADGLVISTPTGSTAYSLSCGGAILQPTMESVILTPIAPHSLSLRPIVISAKSTIKLEVSSRGAQSHLGIDGNACAIPNNTQITICKSAHKVLVAQPEDSDFAQTLRRKLKWGAR